MLIIRDGDDFPRSMRGGVVAIGNFDGVHRGHKVLISTAIMAAHEAGCPAGVIIFEPHPREFFHPEEPHFRLTPLPEKLNILENLGLDFAVVLNFDAELVAMPAERFINEVLASRLGVSHVVIGYDFFFGRKRSGTPETMRDEGEAAGFKTTIVPQQAEDGEAYSSTAIRLHLAQGDVVGAARQLGHWWRVSGPVRGGNKIGSKLGFPTANVDVPPGTALLHAIYAVRVIVGGKTYGGAAYFGGRPSVDNGVEKLEVFLFDFDGDLYGQEITVEFIGFVRPDRRFDGLAALKAQIALDCQAARKILAASGSRPLADLPDG
jgi:riboflavin kinase / FMN adenylyltransferase